MIRIAMAMLLLCAGGHQAFARDDGRWSDADESTRTWFKQLVQPDNPLVSCCGEADAVEADEWHVLADGSIEAIVTNGRGLITEGTRIFVPRRKIVAGAVNPTGHSILFYSAIQSVYCFVLGPLR